MVEERRQPPLIPLRPPAPVHDEELVELRGQEGVDVRVFDEPFSPAEAFAIVDGWLGHPMVTVVQPGDRHAALLRALLDGTGTAGNLTTDAHLAAIAIEHGATLCSADADFGRFGGLRCTNPIA